jgi:hypothetical protein
MLCPLPSPASESLGSLEYTLVIKHGNKRSSINGGLMKKSSKNYGFSTATLDYQRVTLFSCFASFHAS